MQAVSVNHSFKNQPYYPIGASMHIATHFESLEKATKITSRAIDITNLLAKGLSSSLKLFSTQLKDLVLVIESTRLFPVLYPLFKTDEKGRTFFESKSKVQVIEKISLASHLTLKTASGLDRVKLIKLGGIATYSLGHLSIFRWVAESLILSFNFFGAIDASMTVKNTNEKIKALEKEIYNLKVNKSSDSDQLKNIRKLEISQHKIKLENTRGWLKVAATVSKFFVIVIAVTLAATNQALLIGDLTILSLGIISDSFGLAKIYHSEYINLDFVHS